MAEIIKLSFDADKYTTTKALRYIKNKLRLNPIKRGVKVDGQLVYIIRHSQSPTTTVTLLDGITAFVEIE